MTTKGTHSRRNELAEALHKSDQSKWSQQEIVDCLCDNSSHILSHHTVEQPEKNPRLLRFLITIYLSPMPSSQKLS